MKRVRIGLVIGLLAAILLASLVQAAEPITRPTPGLLLWSLETLTEARQGILGGDPGSYRAAFEKLKAEADLALGAGPFSVTYKKSTPPSGDKHDYVSIGIYWWPNPDTSNGLPYVRHDGKVNPEVNNDTFDKAAIGKMSAAVQSLALAYYLTGEERYAEHAAKLLRVWFLDPATRMNPNLNFGQSVPGVNDGRKEGIVETITFTNLGESAQLLSGSSHWREQEMKGLQAWYGEYLKWLRESKIGLAEAAAKNNHGTWYDVQVCYYALFSGQQELARKVLTEQSKMRILSQIQADGQMPAEISRTRSFHYPLYNLRAFISLAVLGEHAGVDLWRYQGNDGRSIKKSLDWLTPYLDGSAPWPHAQIVAENEASAALYLRYAAAAYQDPRYLAAADQLLGEERLTNRSNLIAPKPPRFE